jgi:hypothetical protein
MGIQPIFLFSISRSGSTLVQRILGAHEGIATVSEPWLLLPHAYSLRERGVDAEYVQPLLAAAIEDFCAELPGGRERYLEEVRGFALRLYEQAAGEDATHFLDKTPPYSLVPEEIFELFPTAKFVFLFRNPLSVIASLIRTWGPWHPTLMSSDLYIGLPRLVAARERHRDRSHAVRFEDLLSGDENHWRLLADYIGIEYDPGSLTRFAEVELRGRMGDPTGRKQYSALSAEPEGKWRETLANPLRREWARRYLGFLGRERIATMGYDQKRLLADLASLPPSTDSVLGDAGRAIIDLAKEPIRVRTRRRRIGEPNVIRQLLASY